MTSTNWLKTACTRDRFSPSSRIFATMSESTRSAVCAVSTSGAGARQRRAQSDCDRLHEASLKTSEVISNA